MTKKDLFNLALSYLDIEEKEFNDIENIVDYNSLSKEERACLRMYNTSMLNFLASYPWSFAKKIKKLNSDDLVNNDTTNHFCYKKPDDLGTLLKVENQRNFYVKVIGTRIYTFIENPLIEYTVNELDLNEIDDLVASAIAINLALLISPMLFDDVKKQQTLQYSLAGIIDTLRTRDITEDMGDCLYG